MHTVDTDKQIQKELNTDNPSLECPLEGNQSSDVTLSLLIFLVLGMILVVAICFAFWGPQSVTHASIKQPLWQKVIQPVMGVAKNPNQNHSEDD